MPSARSDWLMSEVTKICGRPSSPGGNTYRLSWKPWHWPQIRDSSTLPSERRSLYVSSCSPAPRRRTCSRPGPWQLSQLIDKSTHAFLTVWSDSIRRYA